MKKDIKTADKNFLFAIFVVFITASCLITSVSGSGTIFHYNSFRCQLIKSAAVFLISIVVTLLNRLNIDRAVRYFSGLITTMALVYFIDNYFFKLSGNLAFYRLWWLSLIHICCAGVYLAIIIMPQIDYEKISKIFFNGYTVLHFISFIAVFLRPYGNEATTNFIIGEGTFRFIPYLLNNPSDSEIWFLLIGNIIFFIPIPFILKNIFKNVKDYHLIIIGLLIPFFIEGYQLVLKCGDVDVDDIILNFSGFIIGYLAMKITNLIKSKK